MNIFDFEKRLKNHATNSRGKVDMDRLLNDLDIKPQSRYKIGYKHFFFTGLVLLGLGYFAFSYMSNDMQESNVNTEVADAANSLSTIKKENTTKSIISKSSKSEENNTPTQNINVKPAISQINKAKQVQSNLSTISTNQKTTPSASAQVTPQNIISERNISPKAIPINLETKSTDSAKPATNSESTTKVESKILAAAHTTRDVNIEEEEAFDKIEEAVGLLPTSSISLLSFLDDDKILNKRGASCPQFSERLWHVYVIPEIGYTFPMKTLTLRDEAYRFVFTERLAHESTIEGINASLSFQFKNQLTGLYVKPGVSYSRFTERIDFVNREIELDTSITIITEGGMEVIEEVIIENERITRSLVHYQLHEFELPVALGYSLNFNQFAIDIEAGIKLNFLQRATGRILSNESDFIDVGNENVDLFKSSVGLGFFGGILFKGQINRRTEIYLGPRFSFNTLSYSSNSNPITQRYNVAGLHAGLIYAIR